MPDIANLLADIPASLPEELVQTLLRAPAVQIVRVVSQGHASPDGFWYDQDENEFVVLISGAARLMFEDQAEPLEMVAGSCVNIPAHRRHRIDWTDPAQPTVWLGVFY
ncbi:MAG TPA: phosphoribosylaminoimidazole carboxylase [Pirellulales bacterium]|jgi:cupin 2 domain-containing protein|nr:phosphoribosylaminoimidazole carboxylase [Pirellulales bacterium]